MKLTKFIFLLSIFLSTVISARGQVMISQYIETNSGNTPKGIEVYNHSAIAIDFSTDTLEIYQGTNGGACTFKVAISNGILGPYQVWVIGTSDLTNYAATGSDIAGVTTYGFNFNGDDALELYLGGILKDVIGECGIVPGTAWSGNGVSTADQNIVIKAGICSGTTTSWTDPSVRYDKIGNGTNKTGFGEAPGCNPNSISTTFVPNAVNVDCATSYTGTVSFTSVGNFNAGNTFTVQLSDINGSFINSINIGSVDVHGTNPSGSIVITIPSNYNAGTFYRVRVVSGNPEVLGSNNGHNIEIINSSPCDPTIPDFGGILLNEFSNGDSGSKEYYELVVVGECGGTTDIRGYIIDDNNGDFGSSGASTGHLKISNHTQWSNIEVGSIIVVYNSSTGERNPHIPVDDLTDSNSDSVYIIPFDDATYLSVGHEFPNSSDNSYSADLNPAPNLFNFTNRIGLSNNADAAQTRKPNGDYFFGISYGEGNTGGVDNTKISNSSMAETNVYFNSGDFRNISNWSIGDATNALSTTDETPGKANNYENQGWIDMLRSSTGNCGLIPLPINLTSLGGKYQDNKVKLTWKSSSEQNNNFTKFIIQHQDTTLNLLEKYLVLGILMNQRIISLNTVY